MSISFLAKFSYPLTKYRAIFGESYVGAEQLGSVGDLNALLLPSGRPISIPTGVADGHLGRGYEIILKTVDLSPCRNS